VAKPNLKYYIFHKTPEKYERYKMTLHKVSNTVAIIIDGKKLMESFYEVQKAELYDYFEDTPNCVSGRKIVVESTSDDEIKYPIEELCAEASNANHLIRGGMNRQDVEELGKKILDLMHLSPFFK
jgi:hypothetical protein